MNPTKFTSSQVVYFIITHYFLQHISSDPPLGRTQYKENIQENTSVCPH